jgi:hypothetical protein
MKRIRLLPLSAFALALQVVPGSAQSLDDLNIQIHGYATQGFLYTSDNNILTTSSSNGSPAWTEAVVNVGAQPIPKLRIGLQGRYFLLGNYGNAITLDWAAADYKANDLFGVRFGKVKTPLGLFNEIQDIDPSYIWSLLPQGVYPITSRNSLLSHYGGVVYGRVNLGDGLGKLEYRGWGGQSMLGSDDGYFLGFREAGIVLPEGLNLTIYGAAIHWRPPVRGLMVGASNTKHNPYHDPVTIGSYSGTANGAAFNWPYYFTQLERNRWMLAGEYTRANGKLPLSIPGAPVIKLALDQRSWYTMGSVKATAKLTGGLYFSEATNHVAALGPARYSKDWAVSARYDFNQFLYAKAEQHFYDGTAIGYDAALNPNGLKPDTKLTILKVGVSF